MIRVVVDMAKIKLACLRKRPGFDHWIALLVVAGLALLIGTVLRGPLNTLATTLVGNMKGFIAGFFNGAAAGTTTGAITPPVTP